MPLTSWSIRVPKSKQQYPSPYGQYSANKSTGSMSINDQKPLDGPSISNNIGSPQEHTDLEAQHPSHAKEHSSSLLQIITHPTKMFSFGQKDKNLGGQSYGPDPKVVANDGILPLPVTEHRLTPADQRCLDAALLKANQDKVGQGSTSKDINFPQTTQNATSIEGENQWSTPPAFDFKRRFSQGFRNAFHSSANPSATTQDQPDYTQNYLQGKSAVTESSVNSRPDMPPPPPPSAVFRSTNATGRNPDGQMPANQHQEIPEDLGLNTRDRAKIFFNRTLSGMYGSLRKGRKSRSEVMDVETGPWVRKEDDAVVDGSSNGQ